REWLGLAVLCLPTLLTTVDVSVLILALPRVSDDLGAGATQQLWITDIYGFMIAGFLVTMGSLGDRIGHRLVLFCGAGAFIVASLLAAYASTTPMLLIARALLGIAAATVMPSVLALITHMFKDPKQMSAAMGVWGSSIMLGVILGPVIGGLMLGAFWWGSVFLMGIPIMLLLLLAGPGLLPNSRNPQAGPLDLLSVVLSLAALLPFVYGLKELARTGWQALPLVAVAVGLLFAALFVLRQRKLTNPMLDLTLFRNPVVSAMIVFGLVIGFIMAGTGLVVTLYMQLVEGLTPLQVGLWMLIPWFAMIIGGNLGPAIARSVKPAIVVAGGTALSAVGAIMVAQVSLAGAFAFLIISLVVLYIGGSPGATLGNFLLMSSAPPEKAGTTGSLSSTGGELGVALGVALLGSVATAAYRTSVDIPAGTPAEQAGPAKESVSGAFAIADQLPASLGSQLLDTAREAFTQSLHVVMYVNAGLFLVLAAVVLVKARHIPPTGNVMPGMPGMAPAPEEQPAPAAN
ncbi:MAG TPA: MFS transporter, partial [Micromonosporaceae bacterium]